MHIRDLRIVFLLIFLMFGCMSTTHNIRKRGRKAAAETLIKIGLTAIKTDTFKISFNSEYSMKTTSVGNRILKKNKKYIFRNVSGKILLNEEILGKKVILKKKNQKGVITLNKSKFRGNLIIKAKGNNLKIINEVDIESYICGIIKREISPTWPRHAIKAQAITARTYALKQFGRHKKDGYDLCDTVHCQVYGGVSGEDRKSNKAVLETKGEVIVFKGKLANVFYHSNCGGYTENASNVWFGQKSPIYLRGRKCGFCKQGSRHKWESFFTYKDIEQKLKSNGQNGHIVGIKKIVIKDKTKAKRAKNVSIVHKNGKSHMKGSTLRRLLGTESMYSTKFTAQRKKNGIIFKGNGWGHGIGLCQWGIKGMAERGYRYKSILQYYFPHTRVKQWKRT